MQANEGDFARGIHDQGLEIDQQIVNILGIRPSMHMSLHNITILVTPIGVYQWYFGGMELLERIIKIQQIPPSGGSRSSRSSDLLTP